MKLKTGAVNRAPTPVEIDGATFYVRPLSGEMYTTFSLFVNEQTDSMLSLRDKRNFIKTHIADWEGLVVIESKDGKDVETEIEFSKENALSLLLDEDADDVMTILYGESLELRNQAEKKKTQDVDKAKKQ